MNAYRGNIVDIENRRIFKGEVIVDRGVICSITEKDVEESTYILPGLVDAHMHIESTMVVPSSFARMAVRCGTVGVVADPHEIANVMGVDGIDYMIQNAKKAPLKCFFGVPSCVPATPFESSGAVLDSSIVDALLQRDDLHFLAEMMNFPGVVYNDEEVHKKIKSALKYGKRIDGHAPGLQGEDLTKYAAASITTDHECFSYEEAVSKIKLGMKILIREGSSAKNFESLYQLIDEYPEDVMLCTDDSHPEDLIEVGHVDKIVRMGVKKGVDIFNLLRAATLNPIDHYALNIGKGRVGDVADFIVVDNLKGFNILKTIIGGECVFDQGKVLFDAVDECPVNRFDRDKISLNDLSVELKSGDKIRVITVEDGELITGQKIVEIAKYKDEISFIGEEDILKMVVLSRYDNTPVQVGFIQNFGLKRGAVASSVAHDSHNIIAAGIDDESILHVINELIKNKGGLVIGDKNETDSLPLEVAGLMSLKGGEEVANTYKRLLKKAADMGTNLKSPFMTLAFMSLLVIPELKLGDKGLFDVNQFNFVDLKVK